MKCVRRKGELYGNKQHKHKNRVVYGLRCEKQLDRYNEKYVKFDCDWS